MNSVLFSEQETTMSDMSETPNRQPDTHQPDPKTRKPYHTPRMEDYGEVNELTRSATSGGFTTSDGITTYNSIPT